MLTAQQLSSFRSQLLKRKKELEVQFEENDHYDLQRSHTDSVSELSSYDNHPGDTGSELYEREKDLALNEHDKLELKAIDEALEAMKVGMYGQCAECADEIPIERLEALPTARYCIAHTPDQDVSRHRPVEEQILTPPFGKYNLDEKDENVGYDAEDSWQDVARYGTSDSPSDIENPPGEYENTYTEWDENNGNVESYENFVGVDMDGQTVTVYPNKEHERYEEALDEEGIMTSFGDLPGVEKESYTNSERQQE
ncbi:TraR/DksA C4-type zinc finger protein [Jeotgalibacillus marinus]|uniref:TraR/DksA C4-type zinc finger protein n=1 Tax=Jeotgalibacillus marinus TaxID=86667 RepID=A0ABV3Q5U5_9BACL